MKNKNTRKVSKNEITLRSRDNQNRSVRKNIFISCEGKTEKTYINSLKPYFNKVAVIKVKHDTRTSALDVVQNFETLFKNEVIEKSDIKLCVFDCDKNTNEQLNLAKLKALKKKKKILFSNPCFEIWLYWHFDKKIKNINQDKLKDFISNEAGLKNYENDEQIYSKLIDKLYKAIDKAKKREQIVTEEGIEPISRASEPYSDMYKLIEYLKQLQG